MVAHTLNDCALELERRVLSLSELLQYHINVFEMFATCLEALNRFTSSLEDRFSEVAVDDYLTLWTIIWIGHGRLLLNPDSALLQHSLHVSNLITLLLALKFCNAPFGIQFVPHLRLLVPERIRALIKHGLHFSDSY